MEINEAANKRSPATTTTNVWPKKRQLKVPHKKKVKFVFCFLFDVAFALLRIRILILLVAQCGSRAFDTRAQTVRFARSLLCLCHCQTQPQPASQLPRRSVVPQKTRPRSLRKR